MFDILFGWRKASKCKKLIVRVQCRLKLIKNKKSCIVRQLREDVVQLLKNGYQDVAFRRAEQLYKDESTVAVYELLDNFCEFITANLSYIRRHKDCPNDINEAVSSLIYASARCGDLPELRAIRKLFGERYGQRFAMSAVELHSGNLVNNEVKERLSMKSVSDDVKQRLVDEIARSNCIKQWPLALEYSSELQQQQMKENGKGQLPDTDVVSDITEEQEMQAPNVREVDGKAIHIDSLTNKNSHSYQDSGISSTSSSSVVLHCYPRIADTSMQNTYSQLCSPYVLPFSSRGSTRINTEKKGRVDEKSSSESTHQFPEEAIVYLDDIQEFQSPKTKERNCQDQRIFVFNSFLHKGEKFAADHNEGCIGQYDPWNEKAGSRRCRKSQRAVRKRSKKKLMARENENIKDVEYEVYYDGSFTSSAEQRSHYQRKHQKKMQISERQQSEEVGSNFISYCNRSYNCELVDDCSLEQACYFCASNDKDDLEFPSQKQKKMKQGKLQGKSSHTCSFQEREQEVKRNYKNGVTLDEACTVQQPQKQGRKPERELGHGSSNGAMTGTWTKKEVQAPYSRARTMPPGRTQDNCTDNILRSNSFPIQQTNHLSHVHPKLPDYDDLAAKFTALKKAYRQTKQPTTTSVGA